MAIFTANSVSMPSVSCSLRPNTAPARISGLKSVSFFINGNDFQSLRLQKGSSHHHVVCMAKADASSASNSGSDATVRQKLSTVLASNLEKVSLYNFVVSERENGFEEESSNEPKSDAGKELKVTESKKKKEYESPFERYAHLWTTCEKCYRAHYKEVLKTQMNICDQCGFHIKMNSSERIALLIDPQTWEPMDQKMTSADPIEWDSEEALHAEKEWKLADKEFQKEWDLYEAELEKKMSHI